MIERGALAKFSSTPFVISWVSRVSRVAHGLFPSLSRVVAAGLKHDHVAVDVECGAQLQVKLEHVRASHQHQGGAINFLLFEDVGLLREELVEVVEDLVAVPLGTICENTRQD